MTEGLFPRWVRSEAVFSSCQQYRYVLLRTWNEVEKPRLIVFLMLNPSKADEYANDPTVERCEVRAREYGFDGMVILNLFAYRSTDPDAMLIHPEPVGPENDEWIRKYSSACEMVVCAWGNDGAHLDRFSQVLKILREAGVSTWALKINEATGHPSHPLYLNYKLKPTAWTPTFAPTAVRRTRKRKSVAATAQC